MDRTTAPSAATATPPTRDPVCGMDVDRERPPGGIVQRGRYVYAFCSDACRGRFEADPMAFIALDPVCGMEVNPKAPKGGQLEHGGRRFYFCSPRCLAKFSADPAPYLEHGPGGMPAGAPPPRGPPPARWPRPSRRLDPPARRARSPAAGRRAPGGATAARRS